METVSSSTAINSLANPIGFTLSCVRGVNPGPSVVVFSDFAATTQALLNSLQGSSTNYFTRPIGDISRMLGDADFRDAMSIVQLWWIDVPTQGIANSVSYYETLGLLLDHTRSHRPDSTLVVTIRHKCHGKRSQTSRVARGTQLRHALRPCIRTIHCTCQYGSEPHHRIHFFTRHVAVQNSLCNHASSPDSPATEAMLASMVEQWSSHHLSHLQLEPVLNAEQSYVQEAKHGLTRLRLNP